MRIVSAKAPNGDPVGFSSFNVIVGGNSVGKTTLLLELYALASGGNRERWFWLSQGSDLEYDSQDPKRDLELLSSSFSMKREGAGIFYFSKAARNPSGTVEQDNRFRFSSGEYASLQDALAVDDEETARQLLFSAIKFWRPFISFADCETRLSLSGEVAVTPYDLPPQDALNVLHRDRLLQREIDERVAGQFEVHPTLLSHRGTQLEFGVSKENAPQFDANSDKLETEYSRIQDWRTESFTAISDVGHGIRSMMKLLITLQDPVSQVVLIDEPEMHIYPAQKRWLGRELVRLAHEQGKQVFMVTHDPILLQGVLDSGGDTRVFRISFNIAGERQINMADLTNLEVGAKRNQDSYLQALFYQRTIAVEGAADRAFYQVMLEELLGGRVRDKDLGFVACGGIGQSKNVAYLVAHVGLLTAFIYDFDALLSSLSVLIDIMALRGSKHAELDRLQVLYRDLGLTQKQLADEGKKGPASDLVKDNQALFDAARDELRVSGLHIVPYGNLENWADAVEDKVRFPERAPDVIKADQMLAERLTNFLDEVLTSLGC